MAVNKNPYTKVSQRGASHSGLSFISLYNCCPMKFFIRYILRIDSKKTAPPLICGTAFHEGKAVFYNTGSLKKAVTKCENEIEAKRDDYEYEEQYEKDLIRFPLLLEVWADTFGYSDLKNFELISVEEEIIVPVPGTNGFVMTMRPDLVYRDKSTGRVFVMDTKTSSFSKKVTEMGLYYGDQATSYLWAVEDKYGFHPEALIGDIAYWNKSAKTEDNISCYRTDWIVRPDSQIEEFKLSIAGLFNEVSQKVAAWKTGNYCKTQLFPRNTFYCNSYAKACDYADICRTAIEDKPRVPPGFKRVPNSKKKNLSSYILDDVALD